jgi:uncharacterized protein (TIGR02452 family)
MKTWKDTKEHYLGKVVPESTKDDFVPSLENIKLLTKKYSQTQVIISKSDCVDMAHALVKTGRKVMLLNMADWYYAGGCVDSGVATQEEECFRRSDYFRHLKQSFYPLDTYDLIVSRGVEYYKSGDANKFAELSEPFNVDMIASPAVVNPPTTPDRKHFLNDTDRQIMINKIRQLIWHAVKNNNHSLVLSAWGCGAFHCPTYEVAQLFKKVLEESNGVLKEVVFSIFGDVNYNTFAEVFLPF